MNFCFFFGGSWRCENNNFWGEGSKIGALYPHGPPKMHYIITFTLHRFHLLPRKLNGNVYNIFIKFLIPPPPKKKSIIDPKVDKLTDFAYFF